MELRRPSGVAVTHLLFAEGALNAAGNGIAKPDHGPQENQGKGKLKGFNHAIRLRDFPLATID